MSVRPLISTSIGCPAVVEMEHPAAVADRSFHAADERGL